MIALGAGLICIPLLDLTLKFLVSRWLGSGLVGLGPAGEIRIVQSKIWMIRLSRVSHLAVLWGVWTLSAGGLITVTNFIPACGWFAGALLGGSLSNVLETSVRNSVCDYICLRFWPAFNLADVAIAAGVLGLGWMLARGNLIL